MSIGFEPIFQSIYEEKLLKATNQKSAFQDALNVFHDFHRKVEKHFSSFSGYQLSETDELYVRFEKVFGGRVFYDEELLDKKLNKYIWDKLGELTELPKSAEIEHLQKFENVFNQVVDSCRQAEVDGGYEKKAIERLKEFNKIAKQYFATAGRSIKHHSVSKKLEAEFGEVEFYTNHQEICTKMLSKYIKYRG